MDQESLQPLMLILAVATPVVGATLLLMGRQNARAADEPLHPSLRRGGWILIAAGPLNLLLWLMFNRWLDAVGYRSVVGYALAAAVFFGVGWGSGWFERRRRSRTAPHDAADPETPPDVGQ